MIHPIIIKLNEAVKIADRYYQTLVSCPYLREEDERPYRPSVGMGESEYFFPVEEGEGGIKWHNRKITEDLWPVPDIQTKKKWDKEASKCSGEFIKKYHGYKSELKLPYSAKDFAWWLIRTDGRGLISRVRQVLDGLVEIRDRRELELETEKATETPPQPGQGEGKAIKKFFRNPWKLAGVIIAFISMICGILQFFL